MSLSKPNIDLSARAFDLPPNHPVESLFKSFPEMRSLRQVNNLFRLIEECYGSAARTAAHKNLFPTDDPSCRRGLMQLSGLGTVTIIEHGESRTILPYDLFVSAEMAVRHFWRRAYKTQKERHEAFRMAAGSLLYGILAAIKTA